MTQPRVQKGIPTGGRWAHKRLSEATGDLSEDADLSEDDGQFEWPGHGTFRGDRRDIEAALSMSRQERAVRWAEVVDGSEGEAAYMADFAELDDRSQSVAVADATPGLADMEPQRPAGSTAHVPNAADEPLPELTVQSFSQPVMSFLVRDDGRDPYDLHAPYQRGSVWDEDRQRSLIRSLTIGVPIGSIVVSELPHQDGRDAYRRVIDGKQRIEAIRAWTNGELSVPGSWFSRGHLKGGESARSEMVTYNDLNRITQRGFEQGTVAVVAFDGRTHYDRDPDTLRISRRHELDEDSLLAAEADVFDLINFGGVSQGDTDL